MFKSLLYFAEGKIAKSVILPYNPFITAKTAKSVILHNFDLCSGRKICDFALLP